MEKETLEEAAVKYSNNFTGDEGKFAIEDFINGAKWQQERSYSEEDLRKAFEFYAERAICDIRYLDDDFSEFIKQFKSK